MIYILKHKKYGTFYGLESATINAERAYAFKTKKQAENKKNKLKHPDRWDVVEVKK